MLRCIIIVLLLLSGCASNQYQSCLNDRSGKDCGIWVVDGPVRPFQQVVRSGDRLFIETVRD